MRIEPRRTERAAAVLRRVLDLVAVVLSGLRKLAVAAAVAGATAWLAWVARDGPADAAEWGSALVLLGLVLVPSAILLVVVAAVTGLRELPARYRELPVDVRQRAGALRPAGGRGAIGVLVDLVRLARLVVGARELLSPYALAAAALRPAVLFAALVAAVAAVLEIPAALIALVLLLFG